ncbi:sugar:proton symporter [Acidovorax sp. SUPP950]|uniref:hypothetical protein n=1 Tax=Acidovorax sp. SUPP950 TaxID=511901 RepID=UPI0023BF85A1|nr:hypothetical protein [Acidovorax sp. SUPP950]GKS77369.1 sugar:proton symporter [Acidovorax sp. SUPP950]
MSHKRAAFTVVVALLLMLGFFYLWAKSEHKPQEAIQVADGFLGLLEAKQFGQAFELTVKHGHVGANAEELQAISARELCKLDRLASTFPFQSNGNRLRRLALGTEIEMPQVQVEFTGACLLGITLRRTAQDGWRVYRFARHAG